MTTGLPSRAECSTVDALPEFVPAALDASAPVEADEPAKPADEPAKPADEPAKAEEPSTASTAAGSLGTGLGAFEGARVGLLKDNGAFTVRFEYKFADAKELVSVQTIAGP